MTHKRPRRWTASTASRGTEPLCIEVTCAEDGLAHRVDETVYAGAGDHQGRYRAVCGRRVLPASMVVAPGRRCPACVRDG